MPTAHEIPLGHSIPSHRVHGWCSHCPGRSLAEEVGAWQVDALDRTASTAIAPSGDDRNAEVERLRTENERMRHELQVMYGGAFDHVARTTGQDTTMPADGERPPAPCGRTMGGTCSAGEWCCKGPADGEQGEERLLWSDLLGVLEDATAEEQADGEQETRQQIRLACAKAERVPVTILEVGDYQEHANAVLPVVRAAVAAGVRRALEDAADHLERQASELWAPSKTAHTVMLADAIELRRLAAVEFPAREQGV